MGPAGHPPHQETAPEGKTGPARDGIDRPRDAIPSPKKLILDASTDPIKMSYFLGLLAVAVIPMRMGR